MDKYGIKRKGGGRSASSDEQQPPPPPLPPVPARTGIHWTCPDCGCQQFATRSQTHEGQCRACGHRFNVIVRAA